MVKTRNWHQLKNKVIKVDSTVESMCVLSYIFLRGALNVNINPVSVRSHHSQTKEGGVSGRGGRGQVQKNIRVREN